MKCPGKKVPLYLGKAHRIPQIKSPPHEEVVQALKIHPSKRTNEQIQTIFRCLLLNKNLLNLLENPERIETASKEAHYISLKRGEVLFFEGDEPDGWYFILDGSVDVIIRLYLIAEDCLSEADDNETTEFAQLMDKMSLDSQIDRLKRVNVINEGQILGQHAYLLDRRRAATIVGNADQTDLIKFSADLFKKTSTHILATNLYNSHKELAKTAFSRLREDQIVLISSLAEVIEVPQGKTITADKSYGRFLYIIKEGIFEQCHVVDFTRLSFRKIDAPFENLELHFPDGMNPVHTGDIKVGGLFQDPSVSELCEKPFIVKAKTDVKLVSFNLDYFRIVAGAAEVALIKEELSCKFTDEEVIRMWVAQEKSKLWFGFKSQQIRESHRSSKSELVRHSQGVIRVPSLPKSIKSYKYKKIVPYAPKRLV